MMALGKRFETAEAHAVPLTTPGSAPDALRLVKPPWKFEPKPLPPKLRTAKATPGTMPRAPRQPPEKPTAENRRGSLCTTSAKPSAPPVPAMLTVKDTFHDWWVGSGLGAHIAGAWLAPFVRSTEVALLRTGTAWLSTRVATAQPLRSLLVASQLQAAGEGPPGQGGPTVSAAPSSECVKYCPPVAPVKPHTAVGDDSASARFTRTLLDVARPAEDSALTLATQAQGL
jgi:hypothetical protein